MSMIRINLLPEEYRKTTRTPIKLMASIAALVAINAGLMAWLGYVHFNVERLVDGEKTTVQSEMSGLKPQLDYFASLDGESKQYKSREQTLASITKSRICWTRKLDEFIDVCSRGGDGERHLVWFDDLQVVQNLDPKAKVPGTVSATGHSARGPRGFDLHLRLREAGRARRHPDAGRRGAHPAGRLGLPAQAQDEAARGHQRQEGHAQGRQGTRQGRPWSQDRRDPAAAGAGREGRTQVNAKQTWIVVLGGGVLLGCGLGAAIWTKCRAIDADRAEIATLRSTIESSRKQIEGTPALEREVIVLRELNEVMKAVLPDTEDVNNLVRTLQRFSEDSHVKISGLKKKPDDTKNRSDFDKVGYTLSLEGDAFQLLDFLNMIENHKRFMRVPTFRIQAAQRSQMEKEGVIAHRVQMDVETFVYEPKKDQKTVKIDGYERKRDLLGGEIQRRRQDLALSAFSYRGQRGRRDPWIDPRVPAQSDSQTGMPVQEQMDTVQKLIERTQEITAQWTEIQKAENVIEQMLKRSEFDGKLAAVEEEVRQLQTAKTITYIPSQRRLQGEVADPLEKLRKDMNDGRPVAGPTENQLREIKSTMSAQTQRGDYKQVLESYKSVEKDLALAESDPLRKQLVTDIKGIEADARTVLDFDKIALRFDGRAYVNGQAIAVINGKIVVHSINRDEIEFLFRGMVFARRF